MAGQLAGAGEQLAAEVAKIGGQTPRHRPGLQLLQQGFPLGQPARQGRDQLAQLLDQPGHQPDGGQADQAHTHPHHQRVGKPARQTAAHQPAAGQIQQEGDQGRRHKQGREGRQGQQQLAQHPEVEHQQGQGQAGLEPGGQNEPFQHQPICSR